MKPNEVYTKEEIAGLMLNAKSCIGSDPKLSSAYSLAVISAIMTKDYENHYGWD
jgi:hypothetical protein